MTLSTATPSGRRNSRRARATTPSIPKRRSRGFHVISWIETHCVFVTGEWRGKPFRLLDWQKQLLLELFELQADGLRRYRWAYISVGKKQGKTELAAALALYFLAGDGEQNPRVICAAAADKQADLVFGAAKEMAALSATLSRITERYEREILCPSVGGKIERVAAAAGTNDGPSISAVICDELHEWGEPKGQEVWNILTNGVGARRQPMVLQITTAGYDEQTVCYRQYEYVRNIERGLIEDPRYYWFIREAPTGTDWKDPAAWRLANPSFGVTVREDFYADQLTKKTEAVFRRYYCNQWMEAEELWLPPGAWEACRSPLDLDPKLPLCVGIDIGLTNDTTAVVAAQAQGGRIVVRAKFWANPFPPGHSQFEAWRLDKRAVTDELRRLRQRFPVPAGKIDNRTMSGPLFLFDPWGFRDEADDLWDEGLAMLEVPQTAERMGPMARALYNAAVEGRIAHDGDPTLAQHLRNVVAVPLGEHGWKLRKITKNSARKIDGAIAAAMAVHQAMAEPPAQRVGAFLA